MILGFKNPPATLQTLDRKYISGVVKLDDADNLESEYLVLIDIAKIFDKCEFDDIPYKDQHEE